MKKIYRIAALLSVVTFAVSGCVEENLEPVKPNKPANNGDEILFGARAGFEDSDPATRTEYSGDDSYQVNGVSYERIDWVTGDKIEIHCPEAINGPTSHYDVVDIASGDEKEGDSGKGSDYASLLRVGTSGLQWNGDGEHTFYAMYPSSLMHTEDPSKTVESGVYMDVSGESVLVKGFIPNVQNPVGELEYDSQTKTYTAKPDMNFAYMVAKSTATREAGNVSLSFVPIVTAVEVELKNNTGATISIGEIQVKANESVAGSFYADLTDWTGTYPECSYIDGSESYNLINITTRVERDGLRIPVPLQAGETLKFTVFLLPGSDDDMIKDISISLSVTGMGSKTKTLTGSEIKDNLKTRIKNLNLPELKVDGDDWMGQMDPKMDFKKLSLPGAGGAFSAGGSEGFRQQSLSFDQLWNLGIRAFEVVSDRPSSATASLGSQNVLCNKKSVSGTLAGLTGQNITVGKVLDELLKKVTTTKSKDAEGNEYLSETAVLILVYQPIGNNPERQPSQYISSLCVMLNENNRKANIIPYSSGLTLEQARGKVILVCRPNQNGEDDSSVWGDVKTALNNGSCNGNVTVVNGCGSGKDRWGARGYQVADYRRSFSQEWGLWEWGSKSHSELVYENPHIAVDLSNKQSISTVEENVVENSRESWIGNIPTTRTGDDVTKVPFIEYYMQQGYLFTGALSDAVKRPEYNTMPEGSGAPEINFGFETNDSNTTCWYQDWARVLAEDKYQESGRWNLASYSAIYWFESYREKESNVFTTFDMAISDEYSNYVFINSLCGYLAEGNQLNGQNVYSLVPSVGSAYGGDGGNIQGLANRLNPAFYKHLLNAGLETATGPTGIIMMDFISDNPADGAAYYLPGAIVANNYKFND
ncbi:MAG: fimbrillin family protein [Bacteroidales bacterium]|nr:fimbrillin family protein [Bacteroidales bacterium]